MSEQETQPPAVLSEEEVKQLQQDITAAKNNVVSEETQKIIEAEREKARKDALQEAEAKKAIEDKEREIAELKKAQEQKEKEAAQKYDALQSKVDELIASKAVTQKDDPFTNNQPQVDVDKMSDDQVNKIEEESARLFLGEDYDSRV